jgi:hypothetical protein
MKLKIRRKMLTFITFILAIVFWPLTLIYVFLVYIVPFLFYALIALLIAAKENPTFSMVVIGILFLWIIFTDSEKDSKTK